ncbi:MAG: DUF5710 domain-containing protein [Pseudomonadota bacterium]
MVENRIYLNVPREQKKEAKALGAKWDRDMVAWYAIDSIDLSLFKKWLNVKENGEIIPFIPIKPVQEKRYYLNINFDLRHIAKSGRAKWDRQKKLWYATKDSDLLFLEDWLPKEYFDEISFSDNPIAEFADKLRSIGLIIEGEHPTADGNTYRLVAKGDKKGDTAGSYVLYPNQGNIGGFGINYRTGEKISWSAKTNKEYNTEQRKIFVAQIKQKRAEALKEQTQLHLETALKTQQAINTIYKPITTPTPYLINKHISITQDTYTDAEGKVTCIPHYDITGFIWCLTYIFPDGSKKYSKNGRKSGCFHIINGFELLKDLPILVIAEGYSTAVSLTEAMGFSVIAAFDNGNLPAVAKILNNTYPDKPIIIAGDDDRSLMKSLGKNPGREKAIEAAEAVQGRAVFPIFTPEEMLDDSKSYTDWNDLAHKSKVGYNEFIRQVREGILKYGCDVA